MYPRYPALHAIFSTAIDTEHFLFAPTRTYMNILLVSHSPFHTPTLADKHMHTFLACPLSICFFLSPHKVCNPLFSPSTFPWGGSMLWHYCVCTGGEEIFSDAMQTSHPADKSDGLTGPCRDAHSHCSLVTGSVALIRHLSDTCYWDSSYHSIKIQFWSPFPSIKHSMHNSDITREPWGPIVYSVKHN